MNRLSALTAILILLAAPLFAQVPCDKSQLCPASSSGAPTLVQKGHCGIDTLASCTITLSTVGAGHYLYVWEGSNGSLGAPTMTGETFTHCSGCANGTGSNGDVYVDLSTVGGQTSLVCNTAGATRIICIASEWTQPSGLPAIDASGNSTNNANPVTVSTSTATTNANDIVIGCFSAVTGSQSFTPISPYVLIDSVAGSGSNDAGICESYAPGSTGTQTATATNSGTPNGDPGGIAALKP